MRLTIKAGTTTTYKNGIETTKNIYCQNVDELMKEFEKQKSEFKNPNVTEDEIMNFTEGVQNSKRIQKLGQYEDIDENPEHLDDIKKALEIIKDNALYVDWIWLFDCAVNNKSYEDYEEGCEANKETTYADKEEYDLFKEVLL